MLQSSVHYLLSCLTILLAWKQTEQLIGVKKQSNQTSRYKLFTISGLN